VQLLADAAEQVRQLESPETGISDDVLSIFNINRHKNDSQALHAYVAAL
jgi:hypothetical protein